MRKALILLLLTCFLVNCKKADNGTAGTKGILFTVSAAAPMSITVYLIRPIAGSATVLDNVLLSNVLNPYTYTYEKTQAGDQVVINVQTTRNTTINGNLYIDGHPFNSTSSALDNGTISIMQWTQTVK